MLKKVIAIIFMFLISLYAYSIKGNAETDYTYQVTSNGELGEGIKYETINGQVVNGDSTSSNIISSYVLAKNVNLVNYASLSSGGIKGKTVLDLAKEYQSLHKDVEVIAAINSDYFASSGSYLSPINSYVVNGSCIKYNNHIKYLSLGYNSITDYGTIKTTKASSSYYLTIYDDSGVPVRMIELYGQDRLPKEGETTFFYSLSCPKDVNTFIYPINATSSFNLGSIYISGSVDKSKETGPVIATKDEEIKSLLEEYSVIEISKRLSGDGTKYLNHIGIGSYPLEDGKIKSFEEIGDQGLDFAKTRSPRSSIGFTTKGEVILCAIDGRSAISAGATLVEEAIIMKSLGARDCFNFDGGGSTELVIKENGEFRYLNDPSEHYRSVVNVVLLTVPNLSGSLDYTVNDDVINYTYDFKAKDGVSSLNVKVLANGVEVTGNSYNINSRITKLCLVATYEVDGTSYTSIISKKTIITENNPPRVIEEPSDFKLSFIPKANGFDALVTVHDPDSLVLRVYLKSGNSKEVCIKDSEGFRASYNVLPGTYTFKIEYVKKINAVSDETIRLEEEYTIVYEDIKPYDISMDYSIKGSNLTLTVNSKVHSGTVIDSYVLTFDGTEYKSNSNVFNLSIKSGNTYQIGLVINYQYNNQDLSLVCNPVTYTAKAKKSGCFNSTSIVQLLSFISLACLSITYFRKK